MKKIFFSVCLAFFASTAFSQQISGDTLAADFRYLVKILEETHPDPYTGFGGKVFFHKEAFDIEEFLSKGTTLDSFAQIALAFISNIEDGHTYINYKKQPNGGNATNLILPLEVTVIPDGLIVSKVTSNYERLLGAKLLSINKVPVVELCNAVGKLSPSENVYGKYSQLCSFITDYSQLRRLLPDMDKTIGIELESMDKTIHYIELTYRDKDSMAILELAEVPKWPKIRDELISYQYLDTNKQAMYFRLSSIMTKEPFIFMRENSWANIDGMLKNVYANFLKKQMPGDMDEAIGSLPELTKTFWQMLKEMEAANAKYLIVDLRNNTGGFTPITLPTLYMLFGDSYFETAMDVSFYRFISLLYLSKINITLEEFNRKNGTAYQLGDYIFPKEANLKKATIEEKREQLIANAMGDAAEYIKDLNGLPLYSPQKIFVIVNERTFSAAFHYTFYLWKMGATVVGVPSKQAPNTYMEGTYFKLPLTKLEGSISNTFQAIFPAGDKRAKIFYPDIMLSREDYDKYKFDKYSDLLFLVDSLGLKL